GSEHPADLDQALEADRLLTIAQLDLVLPARIPASLGGLPPISASFTGRDESLEALLALLAPVSTDGQPPPTVPDVVVTSVSGMAGVRKTELVLQAASIALNRDWFPGGALYVDLFGYDDAKRLEPGQV